MVEKVYAKLKKEFDLPDFDFLNKEFEIATIEPDGFLLREIKRKIKDRLNYASDILNKIIQPETAALSDLYEYRCFDDEDKQKIFELFSRILYLSRKIVESEFLLDEKKDAEIIKEVAEKWPDIRKEMIPFVKSLEACWQEIPSSDHGLKEYLG
ncbi:hypothetical protein GF343_00650 [Candidatus Woesearchaeota archaeon]|nr:hypothetical protein [Candidatus Woesearchaeota archaeon]